VIAGADGGHAAAARLGVEPVDVQQRRARLEGACVLEQLELDNDLCARRQVAADGSDASATTGVATIRPASASAAASISRRLGATCSAGVSKNFLPLSALRSMY
jgi:hypothetical protein